MLTPFAFRVSLSDSLLESVQRFRRDNALDVRTGREAEPEELPFLRSCHRALYLVDLELELLCDEARDALYHPLTRAFAANVNVTVVRIANEAVSTSPQFAIEFIKHDVVLDKGEFEGSATLIQQLHTLRAHVGHPNSPSTAMHIIASASARTVIAASARCVARRRLDRLEYADDDAARSWRSVAVFR